MVAEGVAELGEVEAVVAEVALVFAGDDGDGHVDADALVEGYPVVAHAYLLAAADLLDAADEHEGGDVDGTPLEDEDAEDGTGKEGDEGVAEVFLQLAEHGVYFFVVQMYDF